LIKQTNNNRCIDGNGESVYFGECNSSNIYQKWKIDNQLVKHFASGKCLDSNGSDVYMGNCDPNNEYQQFTYDNTLKKILHNKTKTFLNSSNNKLITSGIFDNIPGQSFSFI
jgi:hypothetical protein